MRRRPLLAAVAAGAASYAPLRPRLAPPKADDGTPPDPGAVDVLLVLAVDVSRSIVAEEARLQREGYRAAVGDPDVVRAIRGGTSGAIGLAYVEWADSDRQRLVLPWTRIASARDAAAWAEALAAAPPPAPATYTSISGAIDYARRVLAEAPWPAARRVVDVSGDWQNNDGDPAADARDRAVAEGSRSTACRSSATGRRSRPTRTSKTTSEPASRAGPGRSWSRRRTSAPSATPCAAS
jgi:hypothetical protein